LIIRSPLAEVVAVFADIYRDYFYEIKIDALSRTRTETKQQMHKNSEVFVSDFKRGKMSFGKDFSSR
jgi:hypothetical protein